MPCYSPLHAYKTKSNDAGKIGIVFSRPASWRGERLDLPCGQCVGCRLERSRQWAVRCMHEASLYEENSFLTLTYEDKYLPANRSLVKSHFQKFMKRLRKSIAPKVVRYYHCGEYGEPPNSRPHYHALLFNHSFSDRKFFKRGANESTLWTSGTLSELWPMGFSVIGDVSFESAAYVARYILKKVTGKKAADHYGERLPEYTTMSRGSKKSCTGGIGKGWYDKFKNDVYPLDRVVVRGRDTRPPRFYDSLLGREDPSTLALLKIDREFNSIHFVTDVLSDGRVISVSDSSGPRLLVKEAVKLASISTLTRPLEKIK
ncbi:MAG: replication initiator protein [Microvirus sp.]|nr:MAG: replication initiator protein [Microvirus sp.]